MISVLIVDDHPVFREGLRVLLETQSDIQVVGTTGSGREAVELVAQTNAQVVLLDIELPDGSGIRICSQILDRAPTCKVLMLSADDTDDTILSALAAGAAGYIVKAEEIEQIIIGVRAADRGETVLPGPVAQKVVKQLIEHYQNQTPPPPDVLAPLTDRERQVFHLAAQGFRNSEIAAQLVISEETIKSHLRNIYSKLGLTNKAELRLFAMQSHNPTL